MTVDWTNSGKQLSYFNSIETSRISWKLFKSFNAIDVQIQSKFGQIFRWKTKIWKYLTWNNSHVSFPGYSTSFFQLSNYFLPQNWTILTWKTEISHYEIKISTNFELKNQTFDNIWPEITQMCPFQVIRHHLSVEQWFFCLITEQSCPGTPKLCPNLT